MKTAFVHDWLVTYGGGEGVVSALMAIWPDATVHTLVFDPNGPCGRLIDGHEIKTSFIQKLPGAKRHHQAFLPLMPLAVEQFDLSAYEVIISSSHAVAKGVLTGPDQLHISYVHSPIRYAWDLQHQYLRQAKLNSGIKGWLAKFLLHYIRSWDYRTSNSVDYFVTNSQYVSRRIWKIYRRKATVIYPPVDVTSFSPWNKKGNYYFTASRLVPYKKIDLIVEAFTRMPEKKLVVVGDGPEFGRVQEKAGKNVEMLGYQPKSSLIDLMQRARAFVFAAEEDFGILPVEAQACGTPVIAFGKGGALETVIDGITGILFSEQTVESLKAAVHRFEDASYSFDIDNLRCNAERFSEERFKKEFQQFVEVKSGQFKEGGAYFRERKMLTIKLNNMA